MTLLCFEWRLLCHIFIFYDSALLEWRLLCNIFIFYDSALFRMKAVMSYFHILWLCSVSNEGCYVIFSYFMTLLCFEWRLLCHIFIFYDSALLEWRLLCHIFIFYDSALFRMKAVMSYFHILWLCSVGMKAVMSYFQILWLCSVGMKAVVSYFHILWLCSVGMKAVMSYFHIYNSALLEWRLLCHIFIFITLLCWNEGCYVIFSYLWLCSVGMKAVMSYFHILWLRNEIWKYDITAFIPPQNTPINHGEVHTVKWMDGDIAISKSELKQEWIDLALNNSQSLIHH